MLDTLKRRNVEVVIDRHGAICYDSTAAPAVNKALLMVRRKVFPSWQILFSSRESLPLYEAYLNHRKIPFVKEVYNGEQRLLLNGKYRPHRWTLSALPK